MLPTPYTPSLPDSIYPPSEDTYLLLDVLSSASETSFLRTHFSLPSPSPLILDVGTGSGTILAFILAHSRIILGRADVLGLGADVNADACGYVGGVVGEACKDADHERGIGRGESGKKKATGTETYLTTLYTNLLPCLRNGKVDLLVFNPPYVPSEQVPAPSDLESHVDGSSSDKRDGFDRTSHLLSLSYNGGKDGMEVTNALLGDLPRVLSKRGVAYVLLCKANGVEEVVKRIQSWEGFEETEAQENRERGGRKGEERIGQKVRKKGRWRAEIVGSSGKKAGWEKLFVVRIWREQGVEKVSAETEDGG